MTSLFLLILAFIWLSLASLEDLKKREVDNWLSFSLIIFSLAYVIFYSLYYRDSSFFLTSLLGLGIFIGLGFLFYYSRVFAGGDAKLLMGLGIFLSISSLKSNLFNYLAFILLVLISGAVYGLIYSLIVASSNRQKFVREIKSNFKNSKSNFVIFLIISLASLAIPIYFKDAIFLFYPVIIILFPILLVYGRAIESCLIKLTPYSKLTVGDWLYREIKIGNKKIKPHWEGLTEEQINLIKKHKKNVLIKNGIPFVPSFLIAFIAIVILWNSGLKFW